MPALRMASGSSTDVPKRRDMIRACCALQLPVQVHLLARQRCTERPDVNLRYHRFLLC